METRFYGHKAETMIFDIVKDTGLISQGNTSFFNFNETAFTLEVSESSIKISRGNPLQLTNEEFQYAYEHRSLNELYTHLLYFFIHNQRFNSIEINQTVINLKVNYSFPIRTQKQDAGDKRVSSNLDLEELKYLLMKYRGGYLIDYNLGNISITNRARGELQGIGYQTESTQSMKIALLEYLERCCASEVLDGTITAKYEDLMDEAINPEKFGIYYDHLLHYSKIQLTRYDPSLEIDWVRAKSLKFDNEKYVPEQMIQYLREDILNRYVYESSNGCALGSSLDEAIFYSILETLERDQFMKSWFYGNPIKEIVFSEGDKRFRGMQLYYQEMGYSLQFFYLDNLMRIPVIWCLITSEDDNNLYYSFTGLGAHLNVKHALESAFVEANRAFKLLNRVDSVKAKEGVKEVESSHEINEVSHHMYYFLSYQSRSLIQDKTKAPGQISYAELEQYSYQDLNISNELEHLMFRIKDYYEDILIIDQKNALLDSFSLFCTKALLIGSVPFDFTSKLIRQYDGDKENIKLEQRNIHPLG